MDSLTFVKLQLYKCDRTTVLYGSENTACLAFVSSCLISFTPVSVFCLQFCIWVGGHPGTVNNPANIQEYKQKNNLWPECLMNEQEQKNTNHKSAGLVK